MENTRLITDPASFRDPAGAIFRHKGAIFRLVTHSYAQQYDQLMSSGLYQALVDKGLLIAHKEVESPVAQAQADGYKVLKPEQIPFISYPYEWCFSQLKDAALTTLMIERLSLERGMSLKDASAYNIQFYQGRPILIDTLSFEPYQEGQPWVAYRQFCQHFLAPLALMAKSDVRLNILLRDYIDGIPLDMAGRILPGTSRLNVGLLTHIYLHAQAQSRYGTQKTVRAHASFSQTARLGLLESLRATIENLNLPRQKSEWGDYYEKTNYTPKAFAHKQKLIVDFLSSLQPQRICDIGANTGLFSRSLSSQNIFTLAVDIDPLAVESSYRKLHHEKEHTILPLIIDVTNPSPAIGWGNKERPSFYDRLNIDTLLALALVHHLAIGNNLPLAHIANLFATLAPQLIIEFVPKEDSQTQKLLANRPDHFSDYHRSGFEAAFSQHFTIERRVNIVESQRVLYLMYRK